MTSMCPKCEKTFRSNKKECNLCNIPLIQTPNLLNTLYNKFESGWDNFTSKNTLKSEINRKREPADHIIGALTGLIILFLGNSIYWINWETIIDKTFEEILQVVSVLIAFLGITMIIYSIIMFFKEEPLKNS